MQTLIRTIVCILLTAQLSWAEPTVVVIGQPVVVSGGCSVAESQSTDADYWPPSGTDYMAQGILSPGSSKTLCAVSVKLQSSTEENLHAELWTTADRSGSQIGSDSQSFQTTNSTSTYSITWSTWPTVSSAYYLHIVADDGSGNFSWRSNTTDTTYGPGNLSDNISRNGGTDLNADAVFSISYQ